MSRFRKANVPRQVFLMAAPALALIVAMTAASARAGAVKSLIEPEVGSTDALPGMPPAPPIPPSPESAAPKANASAPAAAASTPAAAITPISPAPASLPASAAVASEPPSGAAPPGTGGLAVVSWGIGPQIGSAAGAVPAGGPLYLWMTIDGGAAAVDRLRATGPIPVDVHWTRAGSSVAPGAPDLTTRLAIGQPQLASVFAGEVQRQGHFAWHSWARKDSLSPGAWTVSLTYPDGHPLRCGATAPRPCRFSVTIG
jgi:hypothetical protein